MNISKRIAGTAGALLLAGVALVATPGVAQASIPQGASSTVFCPDGTSGCTEYRYGFTVPNSGGQLGIYYTAKPSASGASYRIARVRLVNNSYARIYFDDIGFFTGGHYYRLRLNYGGSVASSSSVSFTDAALGGLSGTGVGKYVTRGAGTYATANPGDSTTWYSTLGSSGITGAFLLA